MKNNDKKHREEEVREDAIPEVEGVQVADNLEEEGAETELNAAENQIADLAVQLEKEKKEYMYLMAEFDNFRKRTLKEKSELIKNAGENVLKGLLPIVDDFERGLKATEDASDAAAVRDGMVLIYNKLIKYLEQNGVKAIDTDGADFDTNLHEAISVIPVPDDSQKGKVLDTVEKGYTINDKLLRPAKVVVGQ